LKTKKRRAAYPLALIFINSAAGAVTPARLP
jgi:hypothetical protein